MINNKLDFYAGRSGVLGLGIYVGKWLLGIHLLGFDIKVTYYTDDDIQELERMNSYFENFLKDKE